MYLRYKNRNTFTLEKFFRYTIKRMLAAQNYILFANFLAHKVVLIHVFTSNVITSKLTIRKLLPLRLLITLYGLRDVHSSEFNKQSE